MIFNDYHSYIASILNKKLIIDRINDVKVLLANTSTLNLLFINASFEIHVRTTFFSFQTIYICTSKPNTQTLVNSLKMSSLKKWVVENKIVSSGPSMKLCSKPIKPSDCLKRLWCKSRKVCVHNKNVQTIVSHRM